MAERWAKAALWGVVVLFAVSAPSEAAIVRYVFEGVVETIVDNGNVLGTDVQVGDTFAGTYSYDSDLVDTRPDDHLVGLYFNPFSSLNATLGSFTLQSGDTDSLRVENMSVRDSIGLGSSDFESDGLSIDGMVLRFTDSTASLWDTDALPSYVPPFDSFDSTFFDIEGNRNPGDIGFDIEGTLTFLIPEPSSLMIILCASPWLLRKRMGIRCIH